jgi:hypothetical protein
MIAVIDELFCYISAVRPDISVLPAQFLRSIYLALAIIRVWNLGSLLTSTSGSEPSVMIDLVYQTLRESDRSAERILQYIDTLPMQLSEQSHQTAHGHAREVPVKMCDTGCDDTALMAGYDPIFGTGFILPDIFAEDGLDFNWLTGDTTYRS